MQEVPGSIPGTALSSLSIPRRTINRKWFLDFIKNGIAKKFDKTCNQVNNASNSARPHRLVVRTSRCGRDNPGSTPGAVISSAQMTYFIGLALAAQ